MTTRARLGLLLLSVAPLAGGCAPLPWAEAGPPAPSASNAAPGAPTAVVSTAPATTPTPTDTTSPPLPSAAPQEGPLQWVKSCGDVEVAEVRAGQAGACNDTNGVVVVSAWHLEGDGKKEHAVGTIDRWQNGKSSLHAVVTTDDATVIAALVSVETATLDVRRESGAIRVTTIVGNGEDYRTDTEIVTFFRDKSSDAAWSGLGSIHMARMDTCSISNAATFSMTDAALERTITSTAQFTAQNLDATLLAELKRDCVPSKPPTKKDKFALAAAPAPKKPAAAL